MTRLFTGLLALAMTAGWTTAFAAKIRRQFLVASATSQVIRSRLGRTAGIRAVATVAAIATGLARATRRRRTL